MKQLEVPIMGQAYVLACPDGSEERMIEAVQRVDSAMCKIRDAGKIRARDRIAVLAALNMAFPPFRMTVKFRCRHLTAVWRPSRQTPSRPLGRLFAFRPRTPQPSSRHDPRTHHHC